MVEKTTDLGGVDLAASICSAAVVSMADKFFVEGRRVTM